jgi:uncharacterized membrane protein
MVQPIKRKLFTGRTLVHALLAVYGLILAYVIVGLVAKYLISADIFFDLSLALLLFALAQSIYEVGLRNASFFILITVAVSFALEVLGTNTGLPFGRYHYTDLLGSRILGVPIAVPLVWFVISYITFSSIASSSAKFQQQQHETLMLKRGLAIAAFAAFGSMAWDIMIDPMFTAYGYWVWDAQSFPVPEIYGVPITNFVGWFFAVFVMVLAFFLFRVFRTKGSAIVKRPNTSDSRVVYLFLMVDGTVANASLGHWFAVLLGILAMGSFLTIPPLVERRKIKSMIASVELRQQPK